MKKNEEMLSVDYEILKTSVPDRANIFPQELENASRQIIKEVEKKLKMQIEQLHIEALRLADQWRENEHTREEEQKPTFLNCKVQRISNVLYIEWRRIYIPSTGKRAGKSIAKALIKTGFIYKESQFEFVPDWARDYAIEIENKFRNIRERSKILSNMLRELGKYNTLFEKSIIK